MIRIDLSGGGETVTRVGTWGNKPLFVYNGLLYTYEGHDSRIYGMKNGLSAKIPGRELSLTSLDGYIES